MAVALLVRGALRRLKKKRDCFSLVMDWRGDLLSPTIAANDEHPPSWHDARREALQEITNACSVCTRACPLSGGTQVLPMRRSG